MMNLLIKTGYDEEAIFLYIGTLSFLVLLSFFLFSLFF